MAEPYNPKVYIDSTLPPHFSDSKRTSAFIVSTVFVYFVRRPDTNATPYTRLLTKYLDAAITTDASDQ